jgi:hypothetical protein
VRELAWSDITEKPESSKGITHPVQIVASSGASEKGAPLKATYRL